MATGADTAVIEGVEPRRNLLMRSDRFRRKALAANLDQAAYVIAGDPQFSEELLLRVQLAAALESITFAVICNKADLADATALIRPRLDLLRKLQVPVFEISAKQGGPGLDALYAWLTARRTLLLGQSGMGKSTLLNRLVPEAGLRTQDISRRLATGKHTTSFTRMFFPRLPESAQGSSALIDSPGFQQFGLQHLSQSELRYGALEFRVGELRCRFGNCRHLDEPGCSVRLQAERGEIDAQRYRLFRTIVLEASE